MDELMILKDLGSMAAAAYTITQSLKMAGMNSKYAMLVSIVIAVALSFAFGLNPAFGLSAGLMAAGTYSGFRSLGKSNEQVKEEDAVAKSYIPHID